MAEATGVDVSGGRLLTREGHVPYDTLILATGARHSYFGHPEWEQHAPGLKSIEDAIRIRRNILIAFERAELEPNEQKRREWLTFVVVGGGPTGVELAGAIAELAQRALASDFDHIEPKSASILLIEAGPRVLPALAERLSQKALESLRGLHVEVMLDKRVENVADWGVLAGDTEIRSRTVLWAAGVAPSPVAGWLGKESDQQGRILVSPDLSVPGCPNVFVIGDAARLDQDGRPLPGLAPVAVQQGDYVARLIARRACGKPDLPPFHYLDKGQLATIGRSSAVADIFGLKLSGLLAWLIWSFVHIMLLVGFRNRLLVFIEWVWAYVTFQRGARLITNADP